MHLRHMIRCSRPTSSRSNATKIETLGSEGTVDDGMVPHVAVVDEIHRARDHHLGTLEMIKAKFGKRRQPMLPITTAGDERSDIWERVRHGRKVVERGNGMDADDLFVVIVEIDADDDPFAERCGSRPTRCSSSAS